MRLNLTQINFIKNNAYCGGGIRYEGIYPIKDILKFSENSAKFGIDQYSYPTKLVIIN